MLCSGRCFKNWKVPSKIIERVGSVRDVKNEPLKILNKLQMKDLFHVAQLRIKFSVTER